jgi:hypothetical protein
VVEGELRARGVTAAQTDDHARRREEAGLWEEGGVVARYRFCFRPAAERRWGWHRL